GKYHPHGDAAVYDTIVRMAQPFSLRYMLVDGQGNFGSVDGDAPAAMRYTEIRMAKIAHEMLADIDKETVDFVPNYDETEFEPGVLPARLPNLLVNGSSGIAVGMATNIPPHNLGEVVDACVALIDDPGLTVEQLMQFLPGPDFPTAGIINGARGIKEAYLTGKGRVYMRARTHIEEDERTGKQTIVATELPFQVNKAKLVERIAELVKDKKLEGVSALRDESDKDGTRVIIELKRGEVAEVMLNNLYQHTSMQTVFGINMVALVDGQPRLLDLKTMLEAFIRHRREVVTRRTVYELGKARDRAHVLEGLAVALANIDPVIALIKASPGAAEAKAGLMAQLWEPGMVTGMLERAGAAASRPAELGDEFGMVEGGYRLSEAQAQAILELRLQRLTGLEQDKIINEYKELLDKIKELAEILASEERLREVVRGELVEIRSQYADERRTEILTDHLDLTLEDLITEEDVVVTLSHEGYAKAQPVNAYRAQKRGGRGKSATSFKDEDFIDTLFVASTHDTILCFSSAGKVYWLKVYELPQASRGARGKPIVNLLPLDPDERITAVLPVRDYAEDAFVFMATRNGTVKKTSLEQFSRPRSTGLIALDLREGDELVGVAITDGRKEVMLFASNGKAIHFRETDVRAMGRTAAGVRGIRLAADAVVNALIIVGDGDILTATENGYGKRTAASDYPIRGRGGQGVISIQTTGRNGQAIGAIQVVDEDEIMLISNGGTLVRTGVAGVSVLGRNTQGVRLIRLGKNEQLVGIDRLEDNGDDEADEANGNEEE
ncbi:MAG TPA: DNA gyrase subunit A, partial [Gammaproteobacteria bacterium]|nr:DNA gyrase subunit A [Gammaproteobacteria bacterium]